MYVLEGATLGGQIISRHLQTQLGINEKSGCAFFGSYGQEVGPLWKSFIAVLSKYPKTQAQNEKIVQSACRTFQSFQDWQKAETA